MEAFDTDHDGEPETVPSGEDVNNNGIDDAFEDNVTPGTFYGDPNGSLDLGSLDTVDTDGLGTAENDDVDYRDDDDDNDNVPTVEEEIDGDCDNDGTPDYLDPDSCNLIPNGFTPTGENPLFVIPAVANAPNFSIEIYNRYGNIVYEYENDGRTGDDILWWNAYSNGRWTLNEDSELVPVGTYFYIINFNDTDNRREPIQGWVYVNY